MGINRMGDKSYQEFGTFVNKVRNFRFLKSVNFLKKGVTLMFQGRSCIL